MQHPKQALILVLICAGAVGAPSLQAQDWPQWLGPNRDGKAAGFAAPKNWPKELIRKWQVTIGRGDATPALAGGKLIVFARDETNEFTACLDAATGQELWRESYEARAATEPKGEHPGPRSSPSVADGKIIVYGARGTLSCLDARAKGKLLWRKDEFAGSLPRFFTASSPLVTDGLCIAQLGGENQGGIVACDLASGTDKWKWTEDGTAYASPTLMTVGGTKMVVALTTKKIVGVGAADGKLLWEAPFVVQGRAYNAATPVVDGATVIYAGAGRGTKAVKIEKAGQGFTARELWSNPDNTVQFNSPLLKDGCLYGISQNGALFCFDAGNGKTLWTANLGGGGFGTLIDAGPVLMALTPSGELVVFESSRQEYKKLAGYQVGLSTYAYPVVTSKGIYIKDKDSVALWILE